MKTAILKAALVFAAGFVLGYGATMVVVPPGGGDKEPLSGIFALDEPQAQNDYQAPPPIHEMQDTPDPPWLTEEEMRTSWLGLPEPRHLTAKDFGITEASASWESWWNYWSECYESVFCWMDYPEPPIPMGPEPLECIAPDEGGACEPRELR